MAKDLNGKDLPKGITQRKDGRYMGRFEYKGEKFTFYNMDLRLLKKEMQDKRYEVEHGLYAKENKLTVGSWFNTWISEYKEPTVKRGTVNVYQKHYRFYIEEQLGKKRLCDVRPEHIQKLYNDMNKEGYSRNTIELVAVVLGGMYKQAVKNRLVRENPVSLATLPRVAEHKESRVMTIDEQKLFLRMAEDSRHYDIFLLALGTGMRSGELRGLEWSDIDFKNKTIHVTGTLVDVGKEYLKDTPKTLTSRRDIPMLDSIVTLLKRVRKEQSESRLKVGDKWAPKEGLDNLVFTMEFGTPIPKNSLTVGVNRVVEKINNQGTVFEHITPHTFRHTFATRCIENGMPPQVLKTILGHSKLSMTMDLYSHVLPDTKADEIQKIANLF